MIRGDGDRSVIQLARLGLKSQADSENPLKRVGECLVESIFC